MGGLTKAALIVLADTETHADLGRIANALVTAEELKKEGDDVQVVFDGAGTKWVPELENPEHVLHEQFEALKDHVAGACAFCASAFQVKEEIEQSDVPLLDEYAHHPSIRRFIADGYQVVTF